jgi:hypothetical protein
MASNATGTLGGRGVSVDHDFALYHWLRMTDAKFGESFWRSARGPHVNITDCEQLKMAIDESCNFDMQQVKDFTDDIKKSDGWSIGFWVKAAGSKSLSNDGKFHPGLSLLHSISPPKPFFGLGKFNQFGTDVMSVYAGTDSLQVYPIPGLCVRECSSARKCVHESGG